MSRVIKFRAWDPIRDEMYQGYDCFNPVPQGYVELQVMQFTGLTDKNGVDIYESDVIEDHIGVGFVEYKERYSAFRVKYIAPVGRGKWFLDYNLKGERESLKVIGNIHQNADLLECKS